MRYVRSVMGRRHAGPGAVRARSAGRVRALHRAAGRGARHLRGLPRRAGIDLEHDRADIARRPPARRSRCWCCGASMASVGRCFDVLALWRERAREVDRPRRCPAATTSPKRRPPLLLHEALAFFRRTNHEHATNRSHRRRRHRQGSHARGHPRDGGRGARSSASTWRSTISISPAGTTARSTARCCPTTGRTRSAATTRSTSAPWAGPRRLPDHVSLWGSLLLFRREFDQYVNLRPARLMPGIIAPVVRRDGSAAPAGRDRHVHRAREHRGRVLQHRRAHVPGHRARDRHAGDGDVAHRRGPRAEVRVRTGASRGRRST